MQRPWGRKKIRGEAVHETPQCGGRQLIGYEPLLRAGGSRQSTALLSACDSLYQLMTEELLLSTTCPAGIHRSQMSPQACKGQRSVCVGVINSTYESVIVGQPV